MLKKQYITILMNLDIINLTNKQRGEIMEKLKKCPICNEPIIEVIFFSYPPKYQRKCGCENKITDNIEFRFLKETI